MNSPHSVIPEVSDRESPVILSSPNGLIGDPQTSHCEKLSFEAISLESLHESFDTAAVHPYLVFEATIDRRGFLITLQASYNLLRDNSLHFIAANVRCFGDSILVLKWAFKKLPKSTQEALKK